ncbi:hypothetical protein OsI_08501 [Oryza sativa Indica Group]|uniref:Uncharacterized protein n=1 Tax=Oryza sativa subsp. indica TaxID=39946 RepID=A2X8E2_ORYSI|nr:hypothetical protein OsI_08501 [Oryza sativa Indica Group]
MACLQGNAMATDENGADDRAGGESTVDHLRSHMNYGDMDLSGEEHVPKARKPYTITKQREKWTDEEHRLFLEALQLHGRAWRRIQEHIGTKTAVQIRSHAQKFFSKVVRESSGSNTGSGGASAAAAAAAIQIPPPRPKRKPAHPYPRKVDGAAKKHVPALRQLEKPPLWMQSLSEQEGSPTSVLTAAQIGTEALGGGFSNNSSGSGSLAPSAAGTDEHVDGGGSPASSVDREDGCLSPSIPTAELAMQAPNTKMSIATTDAKEASSEASVFRLFGKSVVVKDSDQLHLLNGSNIATSGSVERATRNILVPSFAAAPEGSSSNPWPSSMQQFLYFLPRSDGFAAQPVMPWFSYNGSLPCALFYPAAAAAAANQQCHRDSEGVEFRVSQREGSLTGSNTASSVVLGSSAAVPAAAAAAQNSDVAESRGQGNSREAAASPRLTKCESSASVTLLQRGFMPYKRCAAESELLRSEAAGGEEAVADGELTRLCL